MTGIVSQKNSLCVLTGDQTAMGSVEKAAGRHGGHPGACATRVFVTPG